MGSYETASSEERASIATMYLLSGGLGSLFFVLSLLMPIEESEAKLLMGKGLGYGRGRYRSSPWDRPGYDVRQGGFAVDTVENTPAPRPSYYDSPESSGRRRPCVGLCYYEKLLALQGRRDAEREQNETTQEKRGEPCVGICQYYRSLALEPSYGGSMKRNL